MESLLNSVASLISNIAGGASTFCMMMFYEPEVPKSLREE